MAANIIICYWRVNPTRSVLEDLLETWEIYSGTSEGFHHIAFYYTVESEKELTSSNQSGIIFDTSVVLELVTGIIALMAFKTSVGGIADGVAISASSLPMGGTITITPIGMSEIGRPIAGAVTLGAIGAKT